MSSKNGVLIFFKEYSGKNAEIYSLIESDITVETTQDLVGLYTVFERQFAADTDGALLKRARNSIQERIVAASNSRCDGYKKISYAI